MDILKFKILIQFTVQFFVINPYDVSSQIYLIDTMYKKKKQQKGQDRFLIMQNQKHLIVPLIVLVWHGMHTL